MAAGITGPNSLYTSPQILQDTMLSVSKGSEVTLDQAVAGKRASAVLGSHRLLLSPSLLSENPDCVLLVGTQSDGRLRG